MLSAKFKSVNRSVNSLFALLVVMLLLPQNSFSQTRTDSLGDCKLIDHPKIPTKKYIRQSCKFNTPPNTVRNIEIVIDRSNVVFDCNDNILDGQNKLNAGVSVFNATSGDPDKLPVNAVHKFETQKNVTIQNCRIRNYKEQGVSVWVTSNGLYNHRLFGTYANTTRNSKNIIVTKSVIENSGSGVYFSFADESEISNSIIQNNYTVGIYLEAGTIKNKILNNRIVGNGLQKSREGLAIDGSSFNLVKGNYFSQNKEGGIFIYRNAWEHVDKLQTAPRSTISSGNIITENTFENMLIGVWVASRQSMNYSSHSLEWGEASPYFDQRSAGKEYYFNGIIKKNNKRDTILTEGTGQQKILIDHVEKTTVTKNTFINITGTTMNGLAVSLVQDFLNGKIKEDRLGLAPGKNLVSAEEAKQNAIRFNWPNRIIDGKLSSTEHYPFFIHPLMIEADYTFVSENNFITTDEKNAPIGVKTAYRSTIGMPLSYNYILNNKLNNKPLAETSVSVRGTSFTVVSQSQECNSLESCVFKFASDKVKSLEYNKSCLITDYVAKTEISASQVLTADDCMSACKSKLTTPFGKCVYEGYLLLYNVYQKSFGSCQVISHNLTQQYAPNKLDELIVRYPRITKMNVEGIRLCREECQGLAQRLTYLDTNKIVQKIKGGWTCYYGGNKIGVGFIK